MWHVIVVCALYACVSNRLVAHMGIIGHNRHSEIALERTQPTYIVT